MQATDLPILRLFVLLITHPSRSGCIHASLLWMSCFHRAQTPTCLSWRRFLKIKQEIRGVNLPRGHSPFPQSLLRFLSLSNPELPEFCPHEQASDEFSKPL
ncbi:hypothetical protein V8C34DRAFT_291345 [Trichoderma compactum]